MKKLALLLTVILLVGIFAGCQSGSNLSSSQKKEIEKAWDQQDMGDFPDWYDKNTDAPYGLAYYGTSNGYLILMESNDRSFDIVYANTIADCTFKWPTSFHLYAYKDGDFCNLKEAYNKGHISQEGIVAAFKTHKEYVCSAYPQLAESWGYDK